MAKRYCSRHGSRPIFSVRLYHFKLSAFLQTARRILSISRARRSFRQLKLSFGFLCVFFLSERYTTCYMRNINSSSPPLTDGCLFAEMFITCLIIFVVAMFAEAIKVYRRRLEENGEVAEELQMISEPNCSKAARPSLFKQIQRTTLHMLDLILHYFLMLTVMTFNVFIFLSVLLGVGIGNFVFNWERVHMNK